MNKPTKPEKKTLIQHTRSFYFDHASKKVSLEYFLSWIKETIPNKGEDITICLEEDYDDYEGNIIMCYLQVAWKEKVKNTNYKAEIKKYQKKLIKWEKQCQNNQS